MKSIFTFLLLSPLGLRAQSPAFSQPLRRVAVRNALGQLVFTAENTPQIELSALNEGVYWVEMLLEENATALVKRVVVKR